MFAQRLAEIIEEIKTFQKATTNDYFVYRGQADSSWNLRPSLYVQKLKKGWTSIQFKTTENNLYFDFTINAKGILNSRTSSWETLFLMRHYGLPTRILDWTESLNMALYFSVFGEGDSPCIWVLDVHELNELSLETSEIANPLDPRDNIIDYQEAFLPKSPDVPDPEVYKYPFAILAPRMSDRIFAQRGLFTVQTNIDQMIDEVSILQPCFKKIELLKEGITKNMVKEYLKIVGVNHFTVYPDFEGLRMHLMEEHDLK